MGVIFGLALLLTITAVVGHGIWVAVAAIARLIFSSAGPRKSAPPFCPVCGISLNSDVHQCSQCHWQTAKSAKNAAHISLQHINSLQYRGKLKVTTHQEIREVLLQEIGPHSHSFTTSPAAPSSSVAPIIKPDLAAHLPPLAQDPLFTADPVPLPPIATVVNAAATSDPVDLDAPPVTILHEPTFTNPVSFAPFENQTPNSPSELDVQERARRFQARMAANDVSSAASTTDSSAVASPALPKPPRKNWGELFASFMEEKHIRWGELVGGLLIVSCSIALVLSFWSEIADRPLLKFGVFNGVTAALFGLGLHAARRWKLPTTSEGILIIGMLLVPLNFLAIAAFTDGAGPVHWNSGKMLPRICRAVRWGVQL